MNLFDIVNRDPHPAPWAEGDNIPWNEPGFSERMLREHLSDNHDAASRRQSTIDQHVNWIHSEVLNSKPVRMLDLGCGPGLYAGRFARLGHKYVGVDYSPSSIAYARTNYPDCTFIEGDVRHVDVGSGYGFVMMIFGELNVFRPQDARMILQKCRVALDSGGILLLEVHTWDAIQAIGHESPRWRSHNSGLFSPKPHLELRESFWDESEAAATTRFYVVDASTSSVARYAQSFQAYSDDGYRELLASAGFQLSGVYPSLDGSDEAGDFLVYLARAE